MFKKTKSGEESLTKNKMVANSENGENNQVSNAKKKRMLANESALAVPSAKRFLTFERRKSIWGYIFISPWILGVIIFFVIPMVMASIYTFSNITMSKGTFSFEFIGLQNYDYVLTKDPDFIKNKLTPSLMSMIWQVPIIVFFSLFVAMLIKEKFFGRTLARAIFFLPVIVSSGVIIGILKENILGGGAVGETGNQAAYMFAAPSFAQLFSELGVNGDITKIVENVVKEIFDLTWKSGVQILLLLAAVNNIPASSYEVADMEGATAWEKFWKITLPMVSPTLLVAIIYSIIDSFTDYQNQVMKYFMELIQASNYAIATTVAFVYFICIIVIIGIVNIFVSKRVFYYNE